MSDLDSNQPTRRAPADESTEKRRAKSGPRSATVPTPAAPGGPASFPAVPGYAILEVLGRGGMGIVYKARQLGLDRLVALKMIRPGECVDRFRTEAQAAARLQHPNIVQVHEIGEHDGVPYYSLELIEGGSLARRVARQPQPPHVCAALVETLARAVHFAHAQGIIHRDLKPSNILLADKPRAVAEDTATSSATDSFILQPSSLPKIADFGLAKSVADPGRTHTGDVLGTPSYMAPEQARGEAAAVGPAADVYALGAILYELLTGRPPFKGTNAHDTLQQLQTREPVPPSQLQATVPADLETICLKCLQKEPRRRYGSALELADDLRRFVEGRPIVARPVGSVERVIRWARRNPRTAALLGAVAALLLALAGVSWLFTLQLAREKAAVARAKGEADDNARLADENAKLAAERAKAAAEQANLAVEALAALVGKAQALLEDLPNSLKARQELLTQALKLLERVERNHRPGLTDRALATAHKNLGDICLANGQRDQALRHYEKGRELMARLQEADPTNDREMGNLAVFLMVLGDWHKDKDPARARELYEESLRLRTAALNVREGAVLTQAEKKLSVAAAHDRLGTLAYNRKQTEEARSHFEAALALYESAHEAAPCAESLHGLAQSHFFLGSVHRRLGDRDAALDHFAQSQALRRQVYEANRTSFRARNELAAASGAAGELQLIRKDNEAARHSFDEEKRLRRELYDADRRNGPALRRLALALYHAGCAERAVGDDATATKDFDECVRLRRDYAKAAANDLSAQVDLMLACARAGDDREAARIAEEQVRKRAAKDADKVFQIACCYALCVEAAREESDKSAYAAKSMEALGQAWALGFRDVAALDTDPDLDPLRPRAEFQSFRRTLPK
jgi:tetratricopeptide (TPR) repeat protein